MLPRSNEDIYGPVVTGPPPSDQNYFSRTPEGLLVIEPHAGELTESGYVYDYECPEGFELQATQELRKTARIERQCECGATHVLAGISPEG